MDFEIQVVEWVKACQNLINDNYAKNYPSLKVPQLGFTVGKRYVKVLKEGSGVYAFIDGKNGDILKPAAFNAPAKHARENLFSATKGLRGMTAYGPPYLR